jgi:hypothetical protein
MTEDKDGTSRTVDSGLRAGLQKPRAAPSDSQGKENALHSRLYTADQLVALPPPSWLIEDVLPKAALVEVYGRRRAPAFCEVV